MLAWSEKPRPPPKELRSNGIEGRGFPPKVQLGPAGMAPRGVCGHTTALPERATTPMISFLSDDKRRASSPPRDEPTTTIPPAEHARCPASQLIAGSKYSRGISCNRSGRPGILKYATARTAKP